MIKKGQFDGQSSLVTREEKAWVKKVEGVEETRTKKELRAEREEDYQSLLTKIEITASIIEASPDLAELPGISTEWLEAERSTFRQRTVDALKYFIRERKLASFPVGDGAKQESLGPETALDHHQKTRKIMRDAILKKIEQELVQTWEIDIEAEGEKWGLVADNLLKEFVKSMDAARQFKIAELKQAIEKKVESLT